MSTEPVTGTAAGTNFHSGESAAQERWGTAGESNRERADMFFRKVLPGEYHQRLEGRPSATWRHTLGLDPSPWPVRVVDLVIAQVRQGYSTNGKMVPDSEVKPNVAMSVILIG